MVDHADISDLDLVQAYRTGPWDKDEINLLFLLWSRGLSNLEISSKINRPENAIAIKASRVQLPPKQQARDHFGDVTNRNPKAKMRPCLRCTRQFFSEGAGHRICDTCKCSSAWSGQSGHTIHVGSQR